MWTVTFPTDSGDVPSLYLNASGLSGTGVLAMVSEDVAGSTLDGSFRLYSNGGYASGFPLDADAAYLSIEDAENNGTGRSEPLAWNAEAEDVRVAIEGLLPEYASQGEDYIHNKNLRSTATINITFLCGLSHAHK